MTRVAALGILALAVPKTDKRMFLIITGEQFEAAIPVDASDQAHLRGWIAAFNTKAMRLGTSANPLGQQ